MLVIFGIANHARVVGVRDYPFVKRDKQCYKAILQFENKSLGQLYRVFSLRQSKKETVIRKQNNQFN